MSKDPQAELKEAVKRFCRTDKAADNLVKFIQAHQQELLTELLGHRISIVTKDVGGMFVPVSVIARKARELYGR